MYNIFTAPQIVVATPSHIHADQQRKIRLQGAGGGGGGRSAYSTHTHRKMAHSHTLHVGVVLQVAEPLVSLSRTLMTQHTTAPGLEDSNLRGGAVRSLARPTSRCRRTESIVSLGRGVCSCAELQVFSCYRDCMKAYQATRVISTTYRLELSSSSFFSCNARRRRKFTPC